MSGTDPRGGSAGPRPPALRILIVEDGFEYTESLGRFLPDLAAVRAASGPAALAALAGDGPFDAVFLDMRFDRVAEAELLGDVAREAERFNGDVVQARRFLEDHQGTYILAAIRAAGHGVGVLFSYDFADEPRRWERLVARHGRITWVGDNASPAEIRAALASLADL